FRATRFPRPNASRSRTTTSSRQVRSIGRRWMKRAPRSSSAASIRGCASRPASGSVRPRPARLQRADNFCRPFSRRSYNGCAPLPTMEMRMSTAEKTPRRSFLARVFGAAAAASSVSIASVSEAEGAAQATPAAAAAPWLKEVKGTHRCLFDFPQHKNGFPLLHVLNYINTYKEAFKAGAGTVGAVGTFYGIGGACSLPLAFNDTAWQKYGLGDYTGLRDASGEGDTRNPFYRPTKDELHLLMQAVQTPTISAVCDALPGRCR